MFPRIAKFPRRLILTTVYMYCLLLVHRLHDSRQESHEKKEALRQGLLARAARVRAGCAAHPLPLTRLLKQARDAAKVSQNLATYYQGLHMKAALKNVLYMPQYNLSWCLVPKVASTSWSRALLDLQGLTPGHFSDPPLQVILRQSFRPVDPKRVNQTINTSLRFLFVRHPFQRLVSAYRNKLEDSFTLEDGAYFYKNYGRSIVQRFRSSKRKAAASGVESVGEAANNFVDKKREAADKTNVQSVNNNDGGTKTPEEKRLAEDRGQGRGEERRGMENLINTEDDNSEYKREPTFQEYVDYLVNTDVENYDEHWKPISLQCNMCEFDFDYIIKYENFKEEIDYLVGMLQESGRLPMGFHLQWENRGGTDAQATTQKYLRLVSQDKLQLLYEKYHYDFMYFGYTMDGYIEK